ncbi:exosortase system-associated protein, TIGR04073 family [Methylomagnum sp.]
MAFSAAMLLLTGPGAMAAETDNGYGEAVGQKLGSGFSNLTLGMLEVPKNIISTSNQTNLLFGITGGTIKGMAHAMGRAFSGIVDIVSAPMGNKPITNPPYVWQNWYVDTQYGPYFPAKGQGATPTGPTGAGMGRKY